VAGLPELLLRSLQDNLGIRLFYGLLDFQMHGELATTIPNAVEVVEHSGHIDVDVPVVPELKETGAFFAYRLGPTADQTRFPQDPVSASRAERHQIRCSIMKFIRR
jgi:hypothetical protein